MEGAGVMRLFISSVVITLALLHPVQAQQQPQQQSPQQQPQQPTTPPEPGVYGIGGAPCGLFLQAQQENKARLFGEWMAGYISRLNMGAKTDAAAQGGIEAGLQKVQQRCQQNPNQTFKQAVVAVYARKK
jgi:hypothetical protein